MFLIVNFEITLHCLDQFAFLSIFFEMVLIFFVKCFNSIMCNHNKIRFFMT